MVFKGKFDVRWLAIAAFAAFSSFGVHASEPVSGEATSLVETTGTDAGVTVTPIPTPAAVTQLLQPVNPDAKLRAAKKLKQAKKKPFPATMLSRTERQQMALLSTSSTKTDQPQHKQLNDEHSETGFDDIALHSFYKRPRPVADTADGDDADAIGLSDTVKLRLLLARTKAVEAHALASVADDPDEPLSEAVKMRLFMARMKAVQAHQKKFS